MIDAQVIRHLLDAELVIADLSQLNANAFYEIGIRHMAQKPVIHMQLSDDEIPFDLSLYRAIKFSRRRPTDIKKAKEELADAVKSVLAEDYEVDNPVTRVRGKIELEASATAPEKVIITQLTSLEARLSDLERGEVHRNALSTRSPDFNVRIEVQSGIEKSDLERAKDALATIRRARRVELVGKTTILGVAPRSILSDPKFWERAKTELLALPGRSRSGKSFS